MDKVVIHHGIFSYRVYLNGEKIIELENTSKDLKGVMELITFLSKNKKVQVEEKC